ncbi:MAG: hypothetical protein E6G50_11315 [Actinobacteria bacterium]|nr:MAG: hypothetical protein E6G50_11315 [Actinomycetota bacterium]
MGEWHTYTPDGRELFVSDDEGEWTVRCGTALARSRVLDVALIEAIRGDADFFVGVRRGDYAEWVRAQAERIEQERSVG